MAPIKDDTGEHTPVLLRELVDAVAADPDGSYLDATFGRGGHTRALLARLSPAGAVVAMDRDADAVACAASLAARDARLTVLRARFGDLAERLPAQLHGRLAGVMLDVGVSSAQLDDAARGFSFAADGPLDMRMDQRDAETAALWLNAAGEDEIAAVIRRYGEERNARRIARRVIAARPLATTAQLADAVRAALPGAARRGGRHPATRVFQAVRIHINDELGELDRALDAGFAALRIGGRLAAITFHSLEHRLVRRRFRRWVEGAELPRRLPLRGDAPRAARRVPPVGAGQRPSAAEVAANPRARSALLQAVEKVGVLPPVGSLPVGGLPVGGGRAPDAARRGAGVAA